MITSTSNAEIKNIIKLLKNTKLRKEQGVFVVEGIRMFKEVSKQQIKKIYVSETAVEKYKVELENVVYEIVSDHVYKTNVHSAPCQRPLSINTIKIFIIHRLILTLLPPKEK